MARVKEDMRTILVTGATGHQGGAVLRHLLKKRGFRLRAMTRNPFKDSAKDLAKLGIEVVKGDLDIEESLRPALAGVWGVYAVQNSWEAGVLGEEEQGKRLARVARDSGVQRYVQASVGSAPLSTGIPHFDSKYRIEQYVKSLNFPSWAILRPVFFMENLNADWILKNDTLFMALSPTTSLQMIAVDDIGRYGALLFEKAGELGGAEIDLAGDEVTLPQAAELLTEALGRPITFVSVPIDQVRAMSEDMAKMSEWFETVGYSADIDALATKYGIRPLKLGDWLHCCFGVDAPRKAI